MPASRAEAEPRPAPSPGPVSPVRTALRRATARRTRLARALRRALVPAGLLMALALLSAGASSVGRQDAGSEAVAPPAAALTRTATIVLVRHAEKDAAGDPRDPGLSAEGLARAGRLAKLLARSGASRLYASEYRRTRESLAPLAELLGIEVTPVPAAEAGRLARELQELGDGAVAVVAGHSNTVPALAKALGAELPGLAASPHGPVIEERDHGRIFVLTRRVAPGTASETHVLELACPE